jgi:hypothetical protein
MIMGGVLETASSIALVTREAFFIHQSGGSLEFVNSIEYRRSAEYAPSVAAYI